MKNRTVALIALSILLLLSNRPVAAQEPELTIDVYPGLDGYCKVDAQVGWCPVYIEIENQGADIEGRLTLSSGNTGTFNDSSVYARDVVLPTQSRKGYHFLIPRFGGSYNQALEVTLAEGNTEHASETVQVRWLEQGSRLYGVVSSAPSTLDFLSDVPPSGTIRRVAHLDVERLPVDPLGWEGLDLVILNDVDTTQINPAQREALTTWIDHGGHLIVGGGAGAARTAAGISDLLPVELTGSTRSVDTLSGLSDAADGPMVEGPYAVSEVTIQEGQIDYVQDDLLLVAGRAHGEGRVTFLAFDAAVRPFTEWTDNARMWQQTLTLHSETYQPFRVSNGYSAMYALNAIPGGKVPLLWEILLFMGSYVVLVGPVNYFVLRIIGRKELAWITIPALVVLFTLIAYLTGGRLRGSKPIINQIVAVHAPAGAETGRASQLLGVYSPRRARYSLFTTLPGAQPLPGNVQTSPSDLLIADQGDGVTVEEVSLDIGSVRSVLTEGYVDVPPVESGLEIDVKEDGDLHLTGTFGSEVSLTDAVIVVGNRVHRLGDLTAGEERALDLSLVSPLPNPHSYTSIVDEILGNQNYWDNAEIYRKYQFLQALLNRTPAPTTMPYPGSRQIAAGVYLIGWSEDDVPTDVELLDTAFSTERLALFVYSLPVHTAVDSGTGGPSVLIPSGLIDRETESTSGVIHRGMDGIFLEKEAEMVYRFTFWSGAELESIQEIILNVEKPAYDTVSPPPLVAVWDPLDEQWDPLEIDWGANVIPEAERYVSSTGIRIRLQTGDWSCHLTDTSLQARGAIE